MSDLPMPGAQSTGAIRDPARLEALRRLGLLDAAPQAGFDRLTRLVRHVMKVPVSLVSLVEEDRQVFLSAAGLDGKWVVTRETPLTHSFCQHVVDTGERLRIENARAHPLVQDNLAMSQLGVTAYLGMPLLSADGFVVGSLCAIDHDERAWTAEDEEMLADLAASASTELALRELAVQLEARVEREVAARTAAESGLARKRRLEVLGQLAGGVAHDFANVLQTVQAGVRLASKNMRKDPERAEDMLERVADAAKRGGSITRRLLGFARRGEARIEQIDLGAMIQGLQEVLTHTLNQPGLTIQIEAADRLPPVLADPGELETVIVNLATNARDAMPGGGQLRLATHCENVLAEALQHLGLPPGRYVVLAVADTGIGMSAETLRRASEPFFTTKPEGEGTGLGLSMARDFAVQAQGGFHLDSEVGVGTTVTLWLPAAAES